MFSTRYEDLKAHFFSIRDKTHDPGAEKYFKYLPELNRICIESGDVLEGNLFYPGHLVFGSQFDDPPDPRFRSKRRDYATYVMSGSSLLEIGFNGGHSALLALSVNPRLKYHGIDFGNHPYTKPAFEYLKTIFNDRIDLSIGDSRDILPSICFSGKTFDLFHIDGGHDFGVAISDMFNVLKIAKRGDVILFDDTNSGVEVWCLDEICDFFAISGLVSRVDLPKLWESNQHVLLRCI